MAGEATPTAVLYLDVDDEITSAAARIRAAEADRLAIVLPYGSRLATSRINFRLLAREAAARGRQVEVVTPDASARALAASAGLIAHGSVAAFEGRLATGDTAAGPAGLGGSATDAAGVGATGQSALPPAPPAPPDDDGSETRVMAIPRASQKVPLVGRPRPPVRPSLAISVAVLTLVLIGGGALGALIVLPAATITLAPRSEAIGPLELVVEARSDVTAPDPAALTVPARDYPFPVTASQTFTVTGVKVSDTAATGSVKFSNLDTGASNTIPAGSVVRTQTGIEFKTLAVVTLPAASIAFDGTQFIVVPSTSSVGVEALLAGPEGNVAAGSIIVVPKGENGKRTLVTNPDPTTGGEHAESPQVSQADIDAALTTLGTALATAFDAKVAALEGVPAGTTLFDVTKQLGETTPSVDPTTLLNQEITSFELGLSATGTVLGVDPAPVRAVAEARLRSRVPAGWTLDDASIAIDIRAPSVSGGVVSFSVSAAASRVRTVDRDALLAQVQGLLLSEARARLDDYGDVQIALWPDWVTTIPANAGRITFTILAPAASAEPSP